MAQGAQPKTTLAPLISYRRPVLALERGEQSQRRVDPAPEEILVPCAGFAVVGLFGATADTAAGLDLKTAPVGAH